MTNRTARRSTAYSATVRKRVHPAVRAAIEALETRRLLTSIIVNSTSDAVNDSVINGPTVTLREAVNYENANGGGTITFAPALAGQTIDLSSVGDGTFGPTALAVSSNITIVNDQRRGGVMGRAAF